MGRLKILDIPIDSLRLNDVLEIIGKSIEAKQPLRIVTANAEMIMQTQENNLLKECLIQSDLVVADGAGVVWAAKELGSPIPERVAGVDLAYSLLEKASKNDWRIFFFGAGPEVAQEAAEKMLVKFPSLQIVGTQDGFFEEKDSPRIIEKINALKIDILFVALGAPKQELWLENYKNDLIVSLRMGVGGSFDIMADRVKRAPIWMQENSLEWLYRAISQPSRWKRLLALPKFIWAVKSEKTMDNK